MSRYTDSDQAYYEQVTRELQAKENASNYMNLAQVAFRVCVHSFLHSEVTDKEEKCIAAVSKKYIATNLRATSRLAELQALAVRKEREALEAQLRR